MREKVDYMHIILRGGLLAMVCALLSVVWVNDPMLPAGELSGQWLYLAKVAMGAAVGWVVLAFLYYRKGYDMGADFYQVVIWSFIVLAASEAIYGLRQLYGFTSSHHSLYSLSGIKVDCLSEVPHIINRTRTGWCPLETRCFRMHTAEECLQQIEGFIHTMNNVTK